MKHQLDERFTLSSDSYNWILVDKQKGKKTRWHFFPSIKQLSFFLGELKAKESLGGAKVVLRNFSSATPSYSSVIEGVVNKLEHYINSIIKRGGGK